MAKLTEAQRRALEAMPCSITMWGGKPFSGIPEGIRNRSTLWALHKLNLIAITFQGSREHWRITDAGREALAKAEDGR